jgi:hypothetical protein
MLVMGDSRHKPVIDSPPPSKRQCHVEARSPASRPLSRFNRTCHEPTLEAERILMVDFTSTQAQANEVAPTTSHEGGLAEATMATTLSASPPLTADGVDKMYCQLAEIYAMAFTKLAECLGQDWSAEIHRDAIHDKTGTITPY